MNRLVTVTTKWDATIIDVPTVYDVAELWPCGQAKMKDKASNHGRLSALAKAQSADG